MPGGVSFNIGALFGAGQFVGSAVIAICIFIEKEKYLKFEKMIIFRDVGFYIIAILTVIIFSIIGQINLICSIILLLEYCCMVIWVYLEERWVISFYKSDAKRL